MIQKIHQFELKSTAGTDVLDITAEAQDFVSASGVAAGLFTASVPGSTASITTIEFEGGVIEDLKHAIEAIVPRGRSYAHDARWGDGNGYAHVRAALLKPALSLPVSGGELMLGTWQQLVLVDFDNRPRRRKVVFHLMGE